MKKYEISICGYVGFLGLGIILILASFLFFLVGGIVEGFILLLGGVTLVTLMVFFHKIR
ncbi:MAG: hypothetical protein J6N21_07825 [Butyrivibrio sp.]|nr:hypothetical protein [Butyrivibrio sp.]